MGISTAIQQLIWNLRVLCSNEETLQPCLVAPSSADYPKGQHHHNDRFYYEHP